MSYESTSPYGMNDWLLVDDSGYIVAITVSKQMALALAESVPVTIERAARGFYKLGEHLPIFHA